MTSLNFDTLRAEFPSASPAALYDVACDRLAVPLTWATSTWTACSNWMDMFANAPSSYVEH